LQARLSAQIAAIARILRPKTYDDYVNLGLSNHFNTSVFALLRRSHSSHAEEWLPMKLTQDMFSEPNNVINPPENRQSQ
jgi:hypothetical protein